MQTDMTVGKPMKMLLNFTIPVFLGNVFQQLYSMADAVIVGKFVGTKGLAAVGALPSLPGYWLYRQPEMLLFQEGRDRTSVYTVKFKRNS